MSSEQAGSGHDSERIPPLNASCSRQDISQTRCWIRTVDDDGLAFALRQEARLRAPTEETAFDHLVGISGEYAVSGFYGAPVKREIKPDYEGDDGCDLEVRRNGQLRRVEVKTVHSGDLELVVQEDRVDAADYFVLCRTLNPTTMVELVGTITRPDLKAFGERYPNSETIHVSPKYLDPFPTTEIYPDEIRQAQVE